MSVSWDAGAGGGNGGLAALVLLLGYHQIAADPDQLAHALGGRLDPEPGDLVRLARKLGARASLKRTDADRLERIPLPAIGVDLQGDFFVIAAARAGKVLIQRPGLAPTSLEREDLTRSWTGEIILITTRASLSTVRRFDVTWFIPALVKYRGLLGEVLLASLVLQLFALATPLIFQVVIDKVLVHKGLTTLDVLAIGLLAVVAFDTILSRAGLEFRSY